MSQKPEKTYPLPPIISSALDGAPPIIQAVLRAYINALIDQGDQFRMQRDAVMTMTEEFIADMELAMNKPDAAANKQASELFDRLKSSKS